MKSMTVLQVLESYLPQSQNWISRMLSNLTDTDCYIASCEYINPQFHVSPVKLIDLPEYVSHDLIEERNNNTDNFFEKLKRKLKRQSGLDTFIHYLADKAKAMNAGLIHCHFAHVGWNFLQLKKLTGLPFAVSFYGFDYESLPHSFPEWKKRYHELFATADYFICEGNFGAYQLKSSGCPPQKIKIIRLGIEPQKIPMFCRFKNANELHLVQISNYYQKKGHIYTLQAFVQALESCPDMTLTFVGEDSENIKGKLQNIVRENNLSNKVFFIDFIDFAVLHQFLSKYHVLIQPSCYARNRDCEGGAPVIILDAEATGMPVISTTHCDIPEEVIHEKTGLLAPEQNTEALADFIRRFYKMNAGEFNSFSKAARQHMENNYDIRKNASSLSELYKDIVDNQQRLFQMNLSKTILPAFNFFDIVI